ncbi:MAG: hypothetical protein N2606_07860 [Candidatus Omnitrophica bacterium]|nr:hypothetical protein [Candidatus Omnitrophota bacterium]
MNNKGKAVIFLVILIVLSLGLSAYTFYLFQQKSKQYQILTAEYEDLTSKYKARQMELEEMQVKNTELERKVSDLQNKLQDAQKKISALTSDLEKEKATKKQSQDEIARLKASLEEQLKIKQDMEKELTDTVESLKNMESQLKEMQTKLNEVESRKKLLEDRVKELEQKAQNVELGTIVVSSDKPSVSPAAVNSPQKIEGKIAVVNKEYSFAVINLGSRDGVAVGNVFTVLHNNKPIGDIKVEKVHDTMSAAGFVSADLRDKIFEGDKVVLKVQ